MKEQQIRYIYLFWGLLFLLISLVGCQSNLTSKHKVLVIQSYEPNYSGYIKIEYDLKNAFEKQNVDVELHSFYLDCDSYPENEEKARVYNFLDSVAIWNPEIILVYDDQATYSLMACKHPLVKQVPIVFAGVNFPNWALIKEYPNATGLWDKPEFLKTAKMIEELLGYMKINLWIDNTFLGKQAKSNFLEEIENISIDEIDQFRFILKPNGGFDIAKDSSLYKPLDTKPNQSFFMLFNSRESSANNLLWSLSGLTRYSVFMLCKRDFASKRMGLYADAPTFTLVNEGFGFKEGILGGYITSYNTQISESVNIVSKVLSGTDIKDIPIRKSSKEFMIDWTEAERWNITQKNIPQNYHCIKMPFYIRYKSYVIVGSSLLGATILALIIYLTFLYLRENKNKRLAQDNLKKGERFLSLALAGGKVFAFQLKHNIFSFDKDFYPFNGIVEKPYSTDEFEYCIHPEDLSCFKQNILDAYTGALINNISQIRCRFDQKEYQWWEYRYTYNKEEDIFNGLCLNIQKTKEAEKELIEARHKAEESDKMKSAFLANMSHEIRTPLNAIVGFSNIMIEEDIELSTSERKEIQKLIGTNSDLLLKLINDILDLSRIESGKMEFSFSTCNLTDLMDNIYHTHSLLMPRGVELKLETPDTPILIETDLHRLTQVITNFINNASKFTKSGYIKIGYNSSIDKKSVEMFVEDTGIGIPKEKQKDVFGRFSKLNEFAQGTGLGLAICQIIIQRFGGKITLQSEEGKGSRFTITLPLEVPR